MAAVWTNLPSVYDYFFRFVCNRNLALRVSFVLVVRGRKTTVSYTLERQSADKKACWQDFGKEHIRSYLMGAKDTIGFFLNNNHKFDKMITVHKLVSLFLRENGNRDKENNYVGKI